MMNFDSLANLPDYLLFLGSAVLVWAVALAVYELVTPIREFEEIRKGNIAVALNTFAVAIALALPIQSVGHSTYNPGDVLLWGAIGCVCQIVLHLVIRLFWKTTYGRLVARGDDKPCIASALLLSSFSLVVGVLNAAALSY
jgi:putative membrane protein